MPYINKFDRTRFQELVKLMQSVKIDSAGELNYLLTQLTHSFLNRTVMTYQDFNDALGALEGSKLELYRRYVAPYEDSKIKINGDVP